MSKNTKVLVFSAMCLALAFVTARIKLFELPMGGSLTLCSMLFAVLSGYFFGPGPGFVTGIAHGLLKLALGGYILTPVQALLDYPIAFGVMGVSGFFSNQRNGLQKGFLAACLCRWFCSFLSGWIFFAEYAWDGWNPALYSAAYNIIYIAAEAAITLLILQIPAVKDALQKVKRYAVG